MHRVGLLVQICTVESYLTYDVSVGSCSCRGRELGLVFDVCDAHGWHLYSEVGPSFMGVRVRVEDITEG